MSTDSTRGWQRLRTGTDIRGTSEQITDDLAKRIGYVFTQWLARRLDITPDLLKIAVGRDSRVSSPRIAAALIKGITAADSDVFDCGLCSTPAMFMTTKAPEVMAHGAVMVTASHFSADRNGFKFLLAEGHVTAEDTAELLQRAEAAVIPDRLVTKVDFLSSYAAGLERVIHERLEDDAVKPLLGLHVIVDAAGGVGGFYAGLLSRLGADVSGSLNLEPDGDFDDCDPNPESPDMLRAVSKAVLRHGADIGVAFDPDCDRAAIVDQNGRLINRDRLIALVSAILLEEQPGATIVTDSVTSSGLATFITEWGGIHYRFKRGHRNVIDEAIRLNEEGIDCPLAIETSGHAAFRENYFLDDGMYLATRLICEALNRKREGQTLSSLIDELQEPAESIELRLPLKGEDPRESGQAVIEAVLSHTLDDPEWNLAPDNREGVRICFNLDDGINNAWFLLRLSLHDPVMPLNAESDVEGGLKRVLGQLYELLKDSEELLDLSELKKALKA